MSRKPETVFIESVHRHLPPVNELYRMKNHNEYNGGIADVWYSADAADLWVEYKFIKVPVRDTTVIDLVGGTAPIISALQQEWLRSRYAEGRAVGVIVGCADGGVWLPGISWDVTKDAKWFRANVITRKALAELISSLVSK
jgi:hypothetical protein